MHRSRLTHIVIDCNDLDRAASFWSAALDAKVQPLARASAGIYRRLQLPDSDIRLLLQKVPEPKMGKSRLHLDIESDDVEAECARLEALGATRARLVEERGFRFWVMRDPFGNEFCVLQPEFPELLSKRTPNLDGATP